MDRFRVSFRGYDRLEVERYIDDLEKNYNNTLSSQVERINALKMELTIKEQELARYREKESDINEALLEAIDRAKEMDYTAKIRFTLEGERIRIFRSKWMNFCDKYRENVEIARSRDILANYLDAMDREMAKVMERDIGITSAIRRSSAVEDYIDESARVEGFNLDDMSDPPDLRTICDELEENSD